MTVDFQAWSERLRGLADALEQLISAAANHGIEPPAGHEWYELLRHKLLPQVTATPMLVVAVVGGTNIGKSVIFNHLAGERASGVSPMASKTRHPVCLVPPGFADAPLLERVFTGFAVQPWKSPEDPWDDGDEHRLFWRVGTQVPPRLLVLDTPDIDSSAIVNWQRADTVRQTTDLLIAVLTQQKYNDAAVKQFFRKAADADKPVIVVFNQCDLVEDRPYWPQWLSTFQAETGADIFMTYVVPYDRARASSLELPFHAVGADGRGEPRLNGSLRESVASLHFDRLKLRTLRGAWQQVADRERGLPGYLRQLQQVSGDFSHALATLDGEQLARPDWPALPPEILVDEMRAWWNERRGAWTRRIHSAYRTLGDGLLWPAKQAWHWWAGERVDPLVAFRQLERQAILDAIEAMFNELTMLAEVGNDILGPRLRPRVGGQARAQFIEFILREYDRLPPIDDEFREYLRARLDQFVKDNPSYRNVLQWIDQAMAVLRPMITFTFSFGLPIEHALHQAATQALTDTLTQVTVSQVAMNTAIASGTTVAGDALATAGVGEGMKLVAILLRQLQQDFCDRRRDWLQRQIDERLLGDVRRSLEAGASLIHGPVYQETMKNLSQLESADMMRRG